MMRNDRGGIGNNVRVRGSRTLIADCVEVRRGCQRGVLSRVPLREPRARENVMLPSGRPLYERHGGLRPFQHAAMASLQNASRNPLLPYPFPSRDFPTLAERYFSRRSLLQNSLTQFGTGASESRDDTLGVVGGLPSVPHAPKETAPALPRKEGQKTPEPTEEEHLYDVPRRLLEGIGESQGSMAEQGILSEPIEGKAGTEQSKQAEESVQDPQGQLLEGVEEIKYEEDSQLGVRQKTATPIPGGDDSSQASDKGSEGTQEQAQKSGIRRVWQRFKSHFYIRRVNKGDSSDSGSVLSVSSALSSSRASLKDREVKEKQPSRSLRKRLLSVVQNLKIHTSRQDKVKACAKKYIKIQRKGVDTILGPCPPMAETLLNASSYNEMSLSADAYYFPCDAIPYDEKKKASKQDADNKEVVSYIVSRHELYYLVFLTRYVEELKDLHSSSINKFRLHNIARFVAMLPITMINYHSSLFLEFCHEAEKHLEGGSFERHEIQYMKHMLLVLDKQDKEQGLAVVDMSVYSAQYGWGADVSEILKSVDTGKSSLIGKKKRISVLPWRKKKDKVELDPFKEVSLKKEEDDKGAVGGVEGATGGKRDTIYDFDDVGSETSDNHDYLQDVEEEVYDTPFDDEVGEDSGENGVGGDVAGEDIVPLPAPQISNLEVSQGASQEGGTERGGAPEIKSAVDKGDDEEGEEGEGTRERVQSSTQRESITSIIPSPLPAPQVSNIEIPQGVLQEGGTERGGAPETKSAVDKGDDEEGEEGEGTRERVPSPTQRESIAGGVFDNYSVGQGESSRSLLEEELIKSMHKKLEAQMNIDNEEVSSTSTSIWESTVSTILSDMEKVVHSHVACSMFLRERKIEVLRVLKHYIKMFKEVNETFQAPSDISKVNMVLAFFQQVGKLDVATGTLLRDLLYEVGRGAGYCSTEGLEAYKVLCQQLGLWFSDESSEVIKARKGTAESDDKSIGGVTSTGSYYLVDDQIQHLQGENRDKASVLEIIKLQENSEALGCSANIRTVQNGFLLINNLSSPLLDIVFPSSCSGNIHTCYSEDDTTFMQHLIRERGPLYGELLVQYGHELEVLSKNKVSIINENVLVTVLDFMYSCSCISDNELKAPIQYVVSVVASLLHLLQNVEYYEDVLRDISVKSGVLDSSLREKSGVDRGVLVSSLSKFKEPGKILKVLTCPRQHGERQSVLSASELLILQNQVMGGGINSHSLSEIIVHKTRVSHLRNDNVIFPCINAEHSILSYTPEDRVFYSEIMRLRLSEYLTLFYRMTIELDHSSDRRRAFSNPEIIVKAMCFLTGVPTHYIARYYKIFEKFLVAVSRQLILSPPQVRDMYNLTKERLDRIYGVLLASGMHLMLEGEEKTSQKKLEDPMGQGKFVAEKEFFHYPEERKDVCSAEELLSIIAGGYPNICSVTLEDILSYRVYIQSKGDWCRWIFPSSFVSDPTLCYQKSDAWFYKKIIKVHGASYLTIFGIYTTMLSNTKCGEANRIRLARAIGFLANCSDDFINQNKEVFIKFLTSVSLHIQVLDKRTWLVIKGLCLQLGSEELQCLARDIDILLNVVEERRNPSVDLKEQPIRISQPHKKRYDSEQLNNQVNVAPAERDGGITKEQKETQAQSEITCLEEVVTKVTESKSVPVVRKKEMVKKSEEEQGVLQAQPTKQMLQEYQAMQKDLQQFFQQCNQRVYEASSSTSSLARYRQGKICPERRFHYDVQESEGKACLEEVLYVQDNPVRGTCDVSIQELAFGPDPIDGVKQHFDWVIFPCLSYTHPYLSYNREDTYFYRTLIRRRLPIYHALFVKYQRELTMLTSVGKVVRNPARLAKSLEFLYTVSDILGKKSLQRKFLNAAAGHLKSFNSRGMEIFYALKAKLDEKNS